MVKQLLMEFIGVCISNVKGWRLKKALFLVGQGDTGKSQLKSLVERLLGRGNFIGIDLKEIESRFGTGAVYGTRLAGSSDMSFLSVDCKDKAEFVAEGAAIPVYESAGDFNENTIESHKLASIVKLDEDFVSDAGFNIEKYLTEKLGKSFGRAEDEAFINGTGKEEPTGILNDENGADTALTAETLNYDVVIDLYFSVDKEYRKNGIWLMNDKTALTLRKLKDADGNYLWNPASDTILGKQVILSEFMPDIESGAKPIAFGDFSYYWIVGRKPVSVRILLEKYVLYDQIGYLAFEFLDRKLVRKEAIKVIKMAETKE